MNIYELSRCRHKKNICCILSILVIFMSIALPGSAGSNEIASTSIPVWSQFKYSERHSGVSPYPLTGNHTIAWKFDLRGYPQSGSPVIDSNGTIYISTRGRDMDDAHLYAIMPDGREKWNFTFPGYNATPSVALSPEGTIYARGTVSEEKLYAISPEGKEKWGLPLSGHGCGPITVSNDGTIYLFSSSTLFAVGSDGNLKWQTVFPGKGWLCTTPSVSDNGTIYVNFGGEIRALDSAGNEMWRHNFTLSNMSDTFFYPPAISDDGRIYTTYSEIIYGIPSGRRGYLNVFNPDGVILWNYSLTGEMITTPPSVDSASVVYFGTESGHLYAISQGGLLWKFNATGAIRSSPIITSNGTILFGSVDGSFYAVKNSILMWKIDAGGPVDSTSAIDKYGNVYFGSEDGFLYAIGSVQSPEGPKDTHPGVQSMMIYPAAALIAGVAIFLVLTAILIRKR